jgi:hypothetical protein
LGGGEQVVDLAAAERPAWRQPLHVGTADAGHRGGGEQVFLLAVAVEASDGGQFQGDRAGRVAVGFEAALPQLDVGAARRQRFDAAFGAPVEPGADHRLVGAPGARTGVAGQPRRSQRRHRRRRTPRFRSASRIHQVVLPFGDRNDTVPRPRRPTIRPDSQLATPGPPLIDSAGFRRGRSSGPAGDPQFS